MPLHKVRYNLNGIEASTANLLLKTIWPRDVLCKLSDDFQLQDSRLEVETTFTVWAASLAVVLKESLFNCASFLELYTFKEKYGDMDEAALMAMKQGLSCSQTSGDDKQY